MASVLVIEDDLGIRESVAMHWWERATWCAPRRRRRLLAAAVDWVPGVIVLDLGLPDIDGADVLRMLRGVSAVPVIVACTARRQAEIVRLLDSGADDYVVKPAARPPSSRPASGRFSARRPGGTGRRPASPSGLVVAPASVRPPSTAGRST